LTEPPGWGDSVSRSGEFQMRILGRFAWPPSRRENGGAAVRDADFALMFISS
jgi:hypothetical protein